MLYPVMIGVGIGWASMMGTTYAMLAAAIPPERTGIYMGVFNMFIVIPMLIQTVSLPLFYEPLLGGYPRGVIGLACVLMLLGAASTLLVRAEARRPAAAVRGVDS